MLCTQNGHMWSLRIPCFFVLLRTVSQLILEGENFIELGKALANDSNTSRRLNLLSNATHARQNRFRLGLGHFILYIRHYCGEIVFIIRRHLRTPLLHLLSLQFLLLLEQAHILECFEHLLALHLLATPVHDLLSILHRQVTRVLQAALPPSIWILLVFVFERVDY